MQRTPRRASTDQAPGPKNQQLTTTAGSSPQAQLPYNRDSKKFEYDAGDKGDKGCKRPRPSRSSPLGASESDGSRFAAEPHFCRGRIGSPLAEPARGRLGSCPLCRHSTRVDLGSQIDAR